MATGWQSKEWQAFDEEVDKVFEIALEGKVGKKVQVISKIIYSLGLARFGEEEVKTIKPATSGINQEGLWEAKTEEKKSFDQLREGLQEHLKSLS